MSFLDSFLNKLRGSFGATVPIEEIQFNEENAVNSPQDDGDYLKFVVISDTHGQMGKWMAGIPDGDVLIHCGDFTNNGEEEMIREFNQQLAQLPHRHKIVIPGNHELGFDARRKTFCPEKLTMVTNCTFLIDDSVGIEGIKIYGSSWHPLPGYDYYVPQEKLVEEWKRIPKDTEILITHGPPKGILDWCHNEKRCGDPALLAAIRKRNIKYHLFGHIHESYGAMTDGHTTFINACQKDWVNGECQKPVVFYYKKKNGT
ncbi:unnamed protein product, partial [Mesorhabditis spiculigera]